MVPGSPIRLKKRCFVRKMEDRGLDLVATDLGLRGHGSTAFTPMLVSGQTNTPAVLWISSSVHTSTKRTTDTCTSCSKFDNTEPRAFTAWPHTQGELEVPDHAWKHRLFLAKCADFAS